MSPRCSKLALKHYMLKPIQRIPQYKLLLQGNFYPIFIEDTFFNNKNNVKFISTIITLVNIQAVVFLDVQLPIEVI
jgi:FYVE/RhoGEF/PH domain-containing protein 5/6